MGKINLIICKDLSRFGRNYIEVGRSVRQILHDYTYLEHLVQLCTTTVSYKNHKTIEYGKRYCPSHYIKMKDMERVVLEDIRSLAQLVVEDEDKAKSKFRTHKTIHHEEQYSDDTRKLKEGRFRLNELDTLIQSIYEDKVLGKVFEDVAMKLLTKYEAEQKELSLEVSDLEEKFLMIRQDAEDVTLFMERLKKYTDVQELTRVMCLEFIEYITLDAYVEVQLREIYIYYKNCSMNP